jgi:4-alpha-glucanotransferase
MNSTMLDRRRAGLLAPVYALRREGDFGIGDTAAVKEAIDFCADNGFSVLQILPIHETIGDHSPYNPVSSRALSPALLSISEDDVPGLTGEMIARAAPESWLIQLRDGKVRQEAVHPLKTQILLSASYRFAALEPGPLHEDFDGFRQARADWLDSYTLFRLLVREYEGNTQWDDWRPEHRRYDSALNWLLQHPAREDLEELRRGFAFIQWIGYRQWKAVRAHADRRGIRLLGEMSFGVGENSADVWANPSLFDLAWSMGTRPLAHFDTTKDAEHWGQNWGLPPYRWENHRSTSFAWLRNRVAWVKEFFHACRIDHLRGYFRAYMFPWRGGAAHVEFSALTEEEAAEKTGGLLPRFVPGPDDDPVSARMNELQGREALAQIIDAAGEMDLVAEIMGEMPDYMLNTLEEMNLANLSFPQLLRGPEGEVIGPDAFREYSLATYANHDNAPLASLYHQLTIEAREEGEGKSARDLAALLHFAGLNGEAPEILDDATLSSLQRALFRTKARLAVLMCSDLLGIPLRFNLPGSYGRGTWSDRLDMPLRDYALHPQYGPRIQAAANHARESGRA